MKKVVFALILAVLFVGCNSNSQDMKNIEPKLVVGNSLASLSLNDQNEKAQRLTPETKVIFFSFSKKVGHKCNEFLEKEDADFLSKNNAVYIADVSPAPSLIKSMFILPDLKKLKFPILLINDDKTSAEYSKGMDKEKIVVGILDNLKITEIKAVTSTKELSKIIAQ